MPKLSKEQQGQRRARILDAAEHCFARAGFHRTTMQHICTEAGISAGALYLYFDSKEDLIAGIVERDRVDVLAQFSSLAEASDFITGLQGVMRTLIIERPAHKTALIIEMGAEAIRNPAIAAIVGHCDSTIHASMTEMLKRARAAGRIAPKIPVEALTSLMATIADGLFWRCAIDKAFKPQTIADLALRAMAPLIGAVPSETSPADASPPSPAAALNELSESHA